MQPDELIHQPARLKIVSALKALPASEMLTFVRLKEVTGLTDGALGAHLATLEKSGYIDIEKDFHFRKPRTQVRLNPHGRRALAAYLMFLRAVIEQNAENDQATS